MRSYLTAPQIKTEESGVWDMRLDSGPVILLLLIIICYRNGLGFFSTKYRVALISIASCFQSLKTMTVLLGRLDHMHYSCPRAMKSKLTAFGQFSA